MVIIISAQKQQLFLKENKEDNDILASYFISTAKAGLGEQQGSQQTPRGWHVVRAKIGDNQPIGAVFVGRRPTGEIYTPQISKQNPDRDWILTRILWLSGLEIGVNRLHRGDTMRRYIYMHGTPDEVPLGRPGSHGCIRLHNADMLALYQQVTVGTRVYIGD